ncbi:MAG: hypothetical protein CMI53_01730 [Parcubacteria group bacterium]|jgi:hypothetical protein|nr:hypothetical protein [Parcubacteria group bacterium]|tara:strand:+ start:9054 stop:9266 length:213 start_codon:yes stop_codon:yes gene_type:complete
MCTTTPELAETTFGNLPDGALFFLPSESGMSHIQMKKLESVKNPNTYVPVNEPTTTYHAGPNKQVFVEKS